MDGVLESCPEVWVSGRCSSTHHHSALWAQRGVLLLDQEIPWAALPQPQHRKQVQTSHLPFPYGMLFDVQECHCWVTGYLSVISVQKKNKILNYLMTLTRVDASNCVASGKPEVEMADFLRNRRPSTPDQNWRKIEVKHYSNSSHSKCNNQR